jgi:hypothetical protein
VDFENHGKSLPHLSNRTIRFHHPGYRESAQVMGDVLFSLLAVDSENGGLHHATAKTACAIVAGNTWDGYLSDTPDGEALDIGDDMLLDKDDYWFHVPAQASSPISEVQIDSSTSSPAHLPYPVVPTFWDWEFPHFSQPVSWRHSPPFRRFVPTTSEISATIHQRDQSCRITGYRDSLEILSCGRGGLVLQQFYDSVY